MGLPRRERYYLKTANIACVRRCRQETISAGNLLQLETQKFARLNEMKEIYDLPQSYARVGASKNPIGNSCALAREVWQQCCLIALSRNRDPRKNFSCSDMSNRSEFDLFGQKMGEWSWEMHPDNGFCGLSASFLDFAGTKWHINIKWAHQTGLGFKLSFKTDGYLKNF